MFYSMTTESDQIGVDFQWFDVREWGIEGKGWVDTTCYYERLPRRAKQLLPDLWTMSRHCTGFSCDFQTDAVRICAQWNLRLKQLDEPNMTRATFSGLDLYANDKGTWRWAGVGCNHNNQRASDCLLKEVEPIMRHYRLYFPLRNPVSGLKIGVPSEAKFKPNPPRTTKSILFYGSSIVHGAYASRAGMVYPSILGRWLDRPIINLGFSGRAKMERELAYLLAELDPAVFVLDPLPNMDLQLINERAEEFLSILCEARPDTPIIMVEDFPLTHAWIHQKALCEHQLKWDAFARIYHKLQDAGNSNLHYVEGLHSIGDDNAGTVDGIHPNDLGCKRLANNLLPTLRKIVGG